MARPLSAGRITRLVSWRSSLRAFDSSGLRLGAEGFALLRTPMIWVRALSMTSGVAWVLLRASSALATILEVGICFEGRA